MEKISTKVYLLLNVHLFQLIRNWNWTVLFSKYVEIWQFYLLLNVIVSEDVSYFHLILNWDRNVLLQRMLKLNRLSFVSENISSYSVNFAVKLGSFSLKIHISLTVLLNFERKCFGGCFFIFNFELKLELIYLYFPPSFHLTVGCFCPVGLSLL